MAESEEELKSLLMKVKVESEKVGLKLNIQKMKIMASGPITSWEIDGETVETVSDFILGGSKIWKTQQWPQDWKRSVFIPIPKKGNAKECSNYCTIALISHASKVMLKILQARLQQYVNCEVNCEVNHELPDVQAGFRKGRGTRKKIAKICWTTKKARAFQKNIYFFFIDYAKAFDCVDHNKLWEILKRWEYQTT